MGVLLIIPFIILVVIIIRKATSLDGGITCNRCLKKDATFMGSGHSLGGGKVSRYKCRSCGNIIERKIY